MKVAMSPSRSGKLSLRWKLTLSVVSLVMIGFAVTITTLTSRAASMQHETAVAYAEKLARHASGELSASSILPALEAATTLADSLKRLHSEGLADRAVADSLLKGVLAGNTDFIAVATLWEPNAFDGDDNAFVGKPGHDQTGRYIPYWNRGAGSIAVEALVGYETSGIGDYYQLPKRTGKPVLLDPYLYPVAGREVLITTLAVPIHIEGRFRGVVCVDIALDKIQSAVSAVQVYDTGYATLVSHQGVIVGDRDASLVGKNLSTLGLPDATAATIKLGESLVLDGRDERLGGVAVTRVLVPLVVGETGTPWSFVATIPDAEIMAGVVQLRMLSIILGLISIVVVSLGLYFLLERLILRPLGGEPEHAVAAVSRIAEGDLSQPVPVAPGNPASVMAHLSMMQESLARLVGSVRQGAQGVAEASSGISRGNQDLSSHTDQQSGAIKQTSQAMAHMLELVKHNAESADEANVAVMKAADIAVHGGGAMNLVVETMKGIDGSSHQIADIIKVIDAIAFQTNILALNAAVEAARAGEQGRGFAVVASEVRTLASRSGDAAREIRQLIDQNVERVATGARQVDDAGSSMTQMVSSIETITGTMRAITEVSQRQNQDVSQIGDSVTGIEKTTQHNASLVQDMSAAVAGLMRQADELVESVALFRL